MQITPDEFIITHRCRLIYPSTDDFQHIWSASRYPGFNDGMAWDPPTTIEELAEPLRRSQEAWEAGTSYVWTIETKTDHEFIGRIGLRQENQEHNWSLGYWTHPAFQKRGYASEVATAVLNFGFSRIGALRITAAHATWNEASGKVLQRVGMVKTGINPRGFKKGGEWIEEYEYEIRV